MPVPGLRGPAVHTGHHIRWWRVGGRTDLDNLVLIYRFHHRLVHELGWSIRRDQDEEILWFHPDGRRHVARVPRRNDRTVLAAGRRAVPLGPTAHGHPHHSHRHTHGTLAG